MPTIAAWCTTASTPRSAAATAAAVAHVAARHRYARRRSAGGVRWAAGCSASSDGHVVAGRAQRLDRRALPMNPAPPVTSTRITAPTLGRARAPAAGGPSVRGS